MRSETRECYICEVCGREYGTPQEAQECEEGHIDLTGEIWSIAFDRPDKSEMSRWPKYVLLEGRDRNMRHYGMYYVRGDLAKLPDEYPHGGPYERIPLYGEDGADEMPF